MKKFLLLVLIANICATVVYSQNYTVEIEVIKAPYEVQDIYSPDKNAIVEPYRFAILDSVTMALSHRYRGTGTSLPIIHYTTDNWESEKVYWDTTNLPIPEFNNLGNAHTLQFTENGDILYPMINSTIYNQMDSSWSDTFFSILPTSLDTVYRIKVPQPESSGVILESRVQPFRADRIYEFAPNSFILISDWFDFMLRTDDMGENWRKIPIGIDSVYEKPFGFWQNFAPYFFDDNRILIFQRTIKSKNIDSLAALLELFDFPYHRLLYSTNLGETWDTFELNGISNDISTFQGIQFINSQKGFIWFNEEFDENWEEKTKKKSFTVYKTLDGGNSWKSLIDTILVGSIASGMSTFDIASPLTNFHSEKIVIGEINGNDMLTMDGFKSFINLYSLRYEKFGNYSGAIRCYFLNDTTFYLLDIRNGLLLCTVKTITSVQDDYTDISNANIHLYPNPTRDVLHIRTDELISRAELCDVLGNVVKTHTSDVLKTSDEFKSSDVLKTSDVLSINVENLPAGMYFLKLYTMSGEVLVEKVLIGI